MSCRAQPELHAYVTCTLPFLSITKRLQNVECARTEKKENGAQNAAAVPSLLARKVKDKNQKEKSEVESRK